MVHDSRLRLGSKGVLVDVQLKDPVPRHRGGLTPSPRGTETTSMETPRLGRDTEDDCGPDTYNSDSFTYVQLVTE